MHRLVCGLCVAALHGRCRALACGLCLALLAACAASPPASRPAAAPGHGPRLLALPPGREPDDQELKWEIENLSSPEPGSRGTAAREIGFAGAARLGPRLLDMLAREAAPEALDGLLLGLALLGERDAVPRARSLLDHETASVRAAAAHALVLLGERAMFPRIVADIENHALPPELTCEDVLADVGAPEAEGLFRQLVGSDRVQERVTGLVGLSRVNPPAALPLLRHALQSTDPGERARAAYQLTFARDPGALAVLRELHPANPAQNAWLAPELWRRLEELHIRLRDLPTHSLGEVLDGIARETGIPIEFATEVREDLTQARFGAHRLRYVGFDPTALRVLMGIGTRMLRPDRRAEATWIAPGGRIRIVAVPEATRFWSEPRPGEAASLPAADR